MSIHAERDEIFMGKIYGKSTKSIARRLGSGLSTILREVKHAANVEVIFLSKCRTLKLPSPTSPLSV